MNATKIYKVGGAVLAESSGFQRFASLVQSEVAPALFVVSALGLTTRELKNAATIAETKEYERAKAVTESIFRKHLNFARANFPQSLQLTKQNFKPIKQRALRLIRGISLTGFLSKKTLDSVLSIGEELMLAMISAYFNEQNDILIIDSSQLIVTDDNFNNANPIRELCKEKIETFLPHLNQNKRLITQGFVGRTVSGHYSTMGLESSNLTATLLADILDVREVRIQTNVNGIYNADPSKYESVQLIKSMNYNFAKSVAMNGLKLIYGDMIDIAKQKKIRIIYESGLNSEKAGTIIDASGQSEAALIISQENTELLRIHFNSYKERKKLIEQLLNDENLRAKVIFSALMEDYVEIILSEEVAEFQEQYSDYQIFANNTLVKIINSQNIPSIQEKIAKYQQSLISGILFINSDNNIRLLFKDERANEFINEILKEIN